MLTKYLRLVSGYCLINTTIKIYGVSAQYVRRTLSYIVSTLDLAGFHIQGDLVIIAKYAGLRWKARKRDNMDIVICIVCVVLLMVNNAIMSIKTKNKEVKGWKYPVSMYVFTITQIALVLIAYVSIIFYILRG